MSHDWMPSMIATIEDSHLEYNILVRRSHGQQLVTDVNHAIKVGWFPSRSHVVVVIEDKPEYSQMLTRTVYEPREAPTIGELKKMFPTLFDLATKAEGDAEFQAKTELFVLINAYSEQEKRERFADNNRG